MNRKYSYTWLVTAPHMNSRSGLSIRRDLAEKAAKAAASRIIKMMNRRENYYKKMEKVFSKYDADFLAKNVLRVNEIKSGINIEVVKINQCSDTN
jgi:hypothetical protein